MLCSHVLPSRVKIIVGDIYFKDQFGTNYLNGGAILQGPTGTKAFFEGGKDGPTSETGRVSTYHRPLCKASSLVA